MARTTLHLLIAWIAACLPAAPAFAQASQGEVPERVRQQIERFEPPDRARWQKPAVILRVLGVTEGDRIADIGAGTGYLLPFLSAMVGQAGTVWAVDIDEDLLAYVAERPLPERNVKTVLADPDDPKLPENGVDTVIVVNTWHHIDDRKGYIARLGAALTERGRVAIIDFDKRELPVGPPVDHKLDRQAVLDDFESAGWRVLAESTALPYQYFLVFGPPIAPRPLSDTPALPEGAAETGP